MAANVSTGLASGRLRHRVAIERQITTVNTAGEQETVWEHVTDRWAEIAPLSVRESLLAQQVQSGVTGRITMRRFDGLLASMRIVHNGVIYNIVGALVDADSGREYVTCPVGALLNAG